MRNELRIKRLKIDSIDKRICRLLAGRFILALSLKGLKKTAVDRAREKKVLAKAENNAGRAAFRKPARKVFGEIIRQTRRLQGGK